MTSFTVPSSLLGKYDRIMTLLIFVDDDDELKQKYIEAAIKHNKNILDNPSHIDAGFDLFSPKIKDPNYFHKYGDNRRRFFNTNVNKLDFKICCSAQMFCGNEFKRFNTGYYMYPRSSISKTKLRLANNTGIIDAGYRGHIMGMFDVVYCVDNENLKSDCVGNDFDRYVQICAPGLVPILVRVVDSLDELGEETERGSGGFGSTGA